MSKKDNRVGRLLALGKLTVAVATISFRVGSADCETTCDDDQCLVGETWISGTWVILKETPGCFLEFEKNDPDPYYGSGTTSVSVNYKVVQVSMPDGTDNCPPGASGWIYNNGNACTGLGFDSTTTLTCFDECIYDG